MTDSGIFIVNNTGSTVVRDFHAAIVTAILAGGALPEELADLITLTAVTVNGMTRWIVEWA